eukprot:scaffold25191_cov68-Isochrysis_galbana.AAC.1
MAVTPPATPNPAPLRALAHKETLPTQTDGMPRSACSGCGERLPPAGWPAPGIALAHSARQRAPAGVGGYNRTCPPLLGAGDGSRGPVAPLNLASDAS